MKRSGILHTKFGLPLVAIYLLTNSLFVWKYALGPFSPVVATLIYIIPMAVVIVLLFREYRPPIPYISVDYMYMATIIVLAVGLVVLMKQFDPSQVGVGRYPALHGWLARLFGGEYPYMPDNRPSGFPFLFISAIPFYLIGDVGLMQVFAFLIFGWLVHDACHNSPINKYYIIFLLISSPMFLFEIVTRSELFSNIVFILLYLHLFKKYASGSGLMPSLVLGLVGGLLLSTRGIVLLIYIIFFGYYFRKRAVKPVLFSTSLVAGFLLTIAPFAIWRWDYFISQGPFAVQLLYIPGWALGLSLVAAVLSGWFTKSKKTIYPLIAFLLSGVILLAIILYAVKFGWHDTIVGSKFDISYFCFGLPFLLMSLSQPIDNPE